MSRGPNSKANALRKARANARGYVPGHERGEAPPRDPDLQAALDEASYLRAEQKERAEEEWEFTSQAPSSAGLKARLAHANAPVDPRLEALFQQALVEPPDDGVPCPRFCTCRKHEGTTARFLRLLEESK